MENTAIYDTAERYLSGQLDESERDRIDTLLETDQAFGEEFANYLIVKQKLKERAEAERKQALIARLKVLEDKANPARKDAVNSRRILRWFSAAAAVFLVVFVAFWLWQSPSTDALYATAQEEIYQKRIYLQTTRADESRFAELFKNKDFVAALAEAQAQFAQAEASKKWRWQERQGFCYWQLEEWGKALATFQDLAKSPTLLPQKNPARWYLALTYWEMGNEAQSVVLLEEIAALDGYAYQAAAKELLGQR